MPIRVARRGQLAVVHFAPAPDAQTRAPLAATVTRSASRSQQSPRTPFTRDLLASSTTAAKTTRHQVGAGPATLTGQLQRQDPARNIRPGRVIVTGMLASTSLS